MKSTYVLLFFLLLKISSQFLLVHPDFDLQRDEFLHLDQADHLAWGYLSVPPVTSWISLVIRFLGNGEFWVRLIPALIGALTLLVVWKTVKALGGNLFARSLSAIAFIFSAMARLNILFQPNSIDILCWTLVLYTLVRFFQTEQPKWVYLLALSFAFGFLNKYNIAFLALGLLPALILTSQRSIFTSKHLYFALILALLLISPNLYWQWENGFPVLFHMEQLTKHQLVNMERSGFLKEQLLFFYPSIFILVAGLIGLLRAEEFKNFRFLFWTEVFTLAIFTWFQAKGYYALGLYPILLAFGSVWIERLLNKNPDSVISNEARNLPLWKRILKPVLLIIPPLLFLPAFTLIHPVYSPERLMKDPPDYTKLGLNRWEDGKVHAIPQDFADMLGWSELAAKVDSAYSLMPKDGRTMILCGNYGEAGAINYYSKIPELEALTMNADYLYWFDLEEPVKNLILVRVDDEPITQRELDFFEEYREIGRITHPLSLEKGTTIHFLRGTKADLNSILKDEIAEEKAKISGDRNSNFEPQ
jgi:hypothetical protein